MENLYNLFNMPMPPNVSAPIAFELFRNAMGIQPTVVPPLINVPHHDIGGMSINVPIEYYGEQNINVPYQNSWQENNPIVPQDNWQESMPEQEQDSGMVVSNANYFIQSNPNATADEYIVKNILQSSSEPKTLPSDIQKYAIRKKTDISGNSLFHDTSGHSAYSLITGHQDGAGLNVSNDKDFALGQTGKGVLIEFDKDKVFGDRGFSRIIRKPATDFIGEKEFELAQGTIISPSYIKSITINKNIEIDRRLKIYLRRFFDKVLEDEKSITYIDKNKKSKLLSEFEKAKERLEKHD